MLRSEIVSSIDELNEALEECNLVQLFRNIGEEGGRAAPRISSAIIDSAQKYSRISSSFETETQRLVEILDLEVLEEADFWARVMHGEESRPLVHDMIRKLSYARDVLPRLKEVISQEASLEFEKYSIEGRERIEILLFEEEKVSKPSRIAKTLDGVEGLYSVCAAIEEESSSELTVAALDSGSDMSISLLGNTEPIKRLKEIILSVWDRVILHREKKVEERISAIKKSLPVYEEISKLEDNGSMKEERAEKMRAVLDENVSKIVETGAVSSEVQDQTHYRPRKIMSPEQKLLTGKDEASPDQEKPPVEDAKTMEESDSDEDLPFDEEEVGKLKDLLDQAEEDGNDEDHSPDENS